MDTLAPLFAHPGLPRVLRLFLLHPEGQLSSEDLARTKLAPATLASVLTILLKASIVKKSGSGTRIHYRLDQSFPHIDAFHDLLLHPRAFNRALLLKKLSSAGPLRLLALGGVFLGEHTDNIDLLIVSDRVNERKLVAALAAIESELGTDIRYAAMNAKEFHYRMSMYDKLLRQLLEGRHEKLVNKLGV